MKISIAFKLTCLLLLTGFTPFFFLGLVNYHNSAEMLTAGIKTSLVSYADKNANNVSMYFAERKKDLDLLAHSPLFVDKAPALTQTLATLGEDSREYQALDREFSALLSYHMGIQNYDDFLIISPKGDVVFSVLHEDDFGTSLSSGPYKDSELAQCFNSAQILFEPTVSKFRYYPPSDKVTVFVVTPIYREKAVIAFLAAQLNPAAVYDLFQVYAGLGESGETVVLSRIAEEAVYMNPLRHDRDAAFKRKVRIGSGEQQPVQEVACGKSGEGVYTDYRGQEVLAIWRYFPGLEMGMLVKIDTKEAFAPLYKLRLRFLLIALICFPILICMALLLARPISKPIKALTSTAEAMASGNLDVETTIYSRDEIATLGSAFNRMAKNLSEAFSQNDAQNWLKAGVTQLNETMLGERDITSLSNDIITFLATYIDAHVGVFFIVDQDKLRRSGSFAYRCPETAPESYSIGEGLVGQVARERKPLLLSDIPENYLHVHSALGQITPKHILLLPILFEEEPKGVIELGALQPFTDLQQEFLHRAATNIAIAVVAAQAKVALLEAQREALMRVNYLQGLDSPVMAIDRDFQVTFINEAGLVLLGKKEHQVVGKKCYKLWKTGDCKTKNCASGAAMDTDQCCISRTLIRPNGTPLPIQYAGSPLKDAQGDIVGAVEIITDISELTAVLEKSQQLSEELEQQSEELRVSNEELEQQSEELRASNEELEEKTEALEHRKKEVEKRTRQIERAKEEVEGKAKELEQANKYKSEFLANMSHELRTPLNSLLILAKMLADNDEGNLSEEQVESAQIIHNGGQDLLFLINEILDLSKVEAGMMEVHHETLHFSTFADSLLPQFQGTAEKKGIDFSIVLDPNLPASMVTDGQRLEQILRNFLSNAFKFTSQGSVRLEIKRPESLTCSADHLTVANTVLFSVRDTGAGIPEEKQKAIFEAFQQADGSTSRQYGGTGLGLSISRALAQLLKGEIILESSLGEGSTFSLVLPLERREGRKKEATEAAPKEERPQRRAVQPAQAHPTLSATPQFLADDRGVIKEGDRSVLIIEDDAQFSKILMGQARKKGFKCLAAGEGGAGLQLAKEYKPGAIILDLGLPDIDGATVLDGLKYDLATRHIPVHVMSARDQSSDIMQKGAIGFLTKPLDAASIDAALSKIEDLLAETLRNVLIVEDDEHSRKAIGSLIGNDGVSINNASTGAEAFKLIASQDFDCVILDLGLPDMSGFELLQRLDADPEVVMPPVVVYTGRELTREELRELSQYTTKIVVKGVSSPERLLDETSLFLHTVATSLPQEHKDMLRMLHDPEQLLQGRTILLVDDDLRNSFALSKMLKKAGLKVVMAENGQVALERLEADDAIELVLMDIMMPVMDGYEAMGRIRADARYKDLPIVALTAKAMLEDRGKCIKAGANDYLAKPIDTDKLISLMRVLLYR